MGLLPTVTTPVVRHLLDHAARVGVDVDALMHDVGLRAATLEDPDGRLLVAQYFLLWRLLEPQVDSPSFGLELGLSSEVATFGIVGYMMSVSRTLGEAIDRRMAYMRLIGEFGGDAVERAPGEVRIIFHPPPLMLTNRHIPDWLVGATVGLTRRIAGAPVPVKRVVIPYVVDDAARATFEEVLGEGAQILAGEHVAVVFDSSVEAMPVVTADQHLGRFLAARARRMLEEMPPADDEVVAIRRAVVEALRRGQVPTQSEIAKEVAVSVRTLQRRLGDAQTSFSALVDELRSSFARAYLERGDLSNQEIAFALGYAETSAFYRAFRRWTGTTPSAFRPS